MADIKKIFRHCVGVKEDRGAYTPVRFSDSRLELYRNEKPECPYSLCPVGVTMEFYTDAPEISFSFHATSIYYPVEVFDFYENGIFRKSVKVRDGSVDARIGYRLSGKGRTRVEIHLPVGVDLTFRDFWLGNFEPVGADNRRRLLVVGDSISQGLFGINPSVSYVPILARHFDLDYLNISVGGEVYRKGLIDPHLIYKPDMILVALGTNDAVFVRDIEIIGQNISEFFEELTKRYWGVPVYVITPFWQSHFDEGGVDGEDLEALINQISVSIAKTALKHGCTVYIGMDILPHDKNFYSDGAHPNDKGFAVMAHYLMKNLDW